MTHDLHGVPASGQRGNWYAWEQQTSAARWPPGYARIVVSGLDMVARMEPPRIGVEIA